MNKKSLIALQPTRLKPVSFNVFAIYDYETDGIDKSFSQVAQFAALKTDSKLNIITESITNVFVKPRIDAVPSIEAYLTTMIDIAAQEASGMSEFEAARFIQRFFMSQPSTAISGYNTISFDDEFTRRLMFRNMRDVYGHEWKDGNGRVDFYNLIKMIYAYRDDCLKIPLIDGKESLKLEYLSKANGIVHENAHDALSDVYATVSIAKMVLEKEPAIFDYFLKLSNKHNVNDLLQSGNALLYTNNLFNKHTKITTAVMPIMQDENQATKFYCIDLTGDLTPLIELSPDQIKTLIFTKREDLPEGSPFIPTVSVQTNKQPLIREIPEQHSKAMFSRFNLDRDKMESNINIINENLELIMSKLRVVFAGKEFETSDVYEKIYEGFISNKDKSIRDQVWSVTRDKTALQLRDIDVYAEAMKADDPVKMADLLLRAKWNTYYESLLISGNYKHVEFYNWVKDLRSRISIKKEGSNQPTISDFRKSAKSFEFDSSITQDERDVIAKLESHVSNLEKTLIELSKIQKNNVQLVKKEMDAGCSYREFKIKYERRNESFEKGLPL